MAKVRTTTELLYRQQVLEVIDTLARDYLQGKVRAIRLALIALLSGGHLLIEDLPGLGKTSLALVLSRICGLSFGRIQATSDLLPSDITGLSVLDQQHNRFRFIKGPIFNHMVLVDEINRSMPKTQSALLEAMEERRVTVEGQTYHLPDPFIVIATQNPLEQVGTYPLPESQLDRFLLVTGIGYPPPELEQQIIQSGGIREKLEQIEPRLSAELLLEVRRFISDEMTLHPRLVNYIHALLTASRQHPQVAAGISTRGGLALAAASRAQAYLEGRSYVVPEDVQKVAVAVLSHRLMLHSDQPAGTQQEVIKSLLAATAVPTA